MRIHYSFWLLSIPRQFFKMISCSQKLFAQKFKHTGAYIPLSYRNWIFCLSLMSESSYEKFDKSPERCFSSHMPVFERFEYLITGPLNLQITRNQYVGESKGYHGQVQSAWNRTQQQIIELSRAPQKRCFLSPPSVHRSSRPQISVYHFVKVVYT